MGVTQRTSVLQTALTSETSIGHIKSRKRNDHKGLDQQHSHQPARGVSHDVKVPKELNCNAWNLTSWTFHLALRGSLE